MHGPETDDVFPVSTSASRAGGGIFQRLI